MLKRELTTGIPYDSIVDGETLKKVTPVITFRETRVYCESFDDYYIDEGIATDNSY